MESLFRFMLSRQAQKVDPSSTTVPVRPSADYLRQLIAAKSAAQAIPALRRVAAAYRKGHADWTPATGIAYYAAASALRSDLETRARSSLAELTNLFRSRFGDVDLATFVSGAEFDTNYARLSDVLVTNAILGNDAVVAAADAGALLQIKAILQRLAAGDQTLADDGAISEALTRTLLLPDAIFPLLGGSGPKAESSTQDAPDSGDDTDDPRLKNLVGRRKTLLAAYRALTRVGPDHIAEPEPTVASAAPASAATSSSSSAGERATARPMGGVASGSIGAHAGRAPLLLKADAVATFEPAERAALRTLRIDPTKTDLPAAAARVSVELADAEYQMATFGDAAALAMARVGDRYYPASSLDGTHVGVTGTKPNVLPSTHGSLTPAGVGDLLVVKQFLKRYEAREESHIENILKSESKKSIYSRMDLSETTTTTETEVDKEEDRDQQTTERFELATESSNTLKEDSSLKAGLSVSGSYGPIVEFKATTDFATSTAKEEASKVGTKYSKDVTTRATSKIIEKNRRQVVTRFVTKVREKSVHGFDNVNGAASIVGQYQWVDKIYEAQVFNYGKRMLYDIMLPEPAAFLLFASTRTPKSQADLIKPDPFTLSPADLSEGNYPYYVKKYSVAGVVPPPPLYATSSKAVEGKGDRNDDGIGSKSEDVPIPDGYQAMNASVITWFVWFDDSDAAFVDMSLGRRGNQVKVNSGGAWFPTLSSETGTVSFAAVSYKIDTFIVNIEILCQRRPETLDAWRLKTHTAIVQAYQQQLRDYQDQLAALQMQAVQQFQGRNPATNERMIRTELKKGAISLFTEQQYDWLNAIQTSAQGYPELDIAEANLEGRYVRFFEQAFEWEQMMYFFYPYYWGRKSNWTERALLDDPDPLFADFIKAGSARCVLPVRPGFEAAVAYFLLTAQIWNGGDLPPLTDPLYVSIIKEIQERDQAPAEEVAQGEPWDVRLPTSLVYLREERSLPSWHKDSSGDWVPD
jgi:hypothetical protein